MNRIIGFFRRNGAAIAIEVGVNVLGPYLIYRLARPQLGDMHALMAAAGLPIAWSILEFVRHRRIDAVSMLVLAGIGFSLLGYLGGGGVKLLQLRERLVTGAIGLIFLGSAAIGRPLIYQLARARMTRAGDTVNLDRFHSLRDNPHFKRSMLIMTLTWGFGLVIECAVGVALVFALPIATYLLVSPVLGYGTIGLLTLWTFWYARRAQRRGEARQAAAEAEAAAATAPSAEGSHA
jgi:hypothetical protein